MNKFLSKQLGLQSDSDVHNLLTSPCRHWVEVVPHANHQQLTPIVFTKRKKKTQQSSNWREKDRDRVVVNEMQGAGITFVMVVAQVLSEGLNTMIKASGPKIMSVAPIRLEPIKCLKQLIKKRDTHEY